MPRVFKQNMRRAARYIVSEAGGFRSREQVILASGSGVIEAGAVLSKVTATEKYVPYAPDGNDGSEVAIGVLYEGQDTTDTEKRTTITARDTEVHTAVLVWADGVTDAQKTSALAQLEARGIVSR